MRIACATASHISLAICRTHYVQSNAQHCPRKIFPLKHICSFKYVIVTNLNKLCFLR